MPEADDIDAAIAAAEAETGIERAGARGLLCAPPVKRRVGRQWTAEEDKFLTEHLGRLSEQEIAAQLHRTVDSVVNHWKRELHLPSPSKDPRILTAEHVAMGVGLDSKTVHALIDRGHLHGRRLPETGEKEKSATRVVDRASFLRWLVEPASWIYVKPERVGAMMQHGKRGFTSVYDVEFWEDARELVAKARDAWNDEWLTPGQASRIIGINPALKAHNVNRAIHAGSLKAIRWGNWWIRRSDLPPAEMTINVAGRIVPKIKPKYLCPRGMAKHVNLSTCMKLKFCREAASHPKAHDHKKRCSKNCSARKP